MPTKFDNTQSIFGIVVSYFFNLTSYPYNISVAHKMPVS